LLPCGIVDGAVRKFTGNGQIGDADDDITKAAHAFAHFSLLLYSQNNILFCDLQGTYTYRDNAYSSYSSFKLTLSLESLLGKLDKHRDWCFFDPQAHTMCVPTLLI
jgi:hypothetical protein